MAFWYRSREESEAGEPEVVTEAVAEEPRCRYDGSRFARSFVVREAEPPCGEAGRAREIGAPDPAEELSERLLAAAAAMRPVAAALERLQAATFAAMRDRGAVRATGHLDLATMVERHAPMSERSLQELVRLHRVLEKWPELARAFAAGEITKHQALAIAPMLEAEGADVCAWIERAKACGVRELKRQVRATRPDVPDADPEGRTVTMSAPPGVWLQYRAFVETGRKVLGFRAPAWQIIEAALMESGFAGSGSAQDERQGSPRGRLRHEPAEVEVSGVWLERAEATIREVREHLDAVRGLITPGIPCDLEAVLDRVEQIERLRRPLHILEGRILNALCGCGALERFGYRAIGELAQDRMGICERTAHYRMNLADICGDAPLLERAILDGEIGETAARLLRSVRSSAVDLPAWIERASRIPVSQLEDEIEIRRKMRLVDPLLVGIFHGPFPHPGLEKALHRLLARRGRPAPAVEAFLRKKGIPLTREGNWRDPAEQPSILRRLEAMLEILLEKEFDLLPDLDPAQTSARRRRVHVRFRAPNAVANDLEAALATLDERWKEANRPPAPRWLFFSLLMKHATEEWLRVDPSRVPERNEIYERDGYQCQAPHCRRRSRLHSHHIWPLGLGGPDTPWNQVTVCDAHHVLIHAGVVHVRGTAPDGLTWHMGCRPGRPSLESFRGRRRIARRGRRQ